MAIDKELLEILVCPKCKGALTLPPKEETLNCEACRVKYPIREDIPIMLIDQAIPMD